jgi:hypothetical protein
MYAIIGTVYVFTSVFWFESGATQVDRDAFSVTMLFIIVIIYSKAVDSSLTGVRHDLSSAVFQTLGSENFEFRVGFRQQFKAIP